MSTDWFQKSMNTLSLNGKSERTQQAYTRALRMLVDFCGKRPEEITEAELETYFLRRKNVDRWSSNTLRICYCGIRFYFVHVLGRNFGLFNILRARNESRLPTVLSREEVRALLACVRTAHNRAFLSTVYACGLRLQEALHLEVSDIDSGRMMLHVHRGKGAKDRLVPLPQSTLATLRAHWRTHRHPRWLFPALGRSGQAAAGATTPMAISSVQGALRRAKHQARIAKRAVSIHTLRHAYATHLLEEGVNLRVIQRHRGHASLESTMVYLHLTHKGQEDAYALIDRLRWGTCDMGALQQLFREHGAGYLARFGDSMPNNHRKVIGAIERCRSEQAGHTLYHCQACGKSHVIARACGNRHCPGCQHHKTQAWLQCQLQRQLPGAHFMLTFTVPASLREFVRSHQRAGYAALFEASAGAIKKLAADPRYLGGDLAGFLGVLHTWGRQLQYHPHIHYLVPGGALSSTDRQWHASSAGFYLPVRALSKIFRAKFRDAMAAQGLLADIPAEAWGIDWNVNCQAVGDGQASLAYLARYVFKVAISERRIVSIDEHAVTFRYRKVHSHRARTMRLPIAEFLRRFLQHVLPTGFMKVRYYGFLSPSCSVPIEELKARIAMAHGFAQQPPPIEIEPPAPMRCPHCGGSLRFVRSMGMAKPQRSLAAASVGAPHSGP